MKRRSALVAGLCFVLSGCVVGERLVTGRGDYRTYRETVVGKTELERLSAGHRYLVEYPNGRYHQQVKAWFQEHDARFVKRAYDRPSALRAYLKVIPNGPRSAQVQDRLTELDIHRGYQKRDDDRETAKLARVANELGEATRSRRELVRRFAALVSKLSGVRAFGLPLSGLDAELSAEFRGPGGLSCQPERCFKAFTLGYAVPSKSQFVARTAQFELLTVAVAGRIDRVELGGPELFTRVGEAVDRRVVAADSLSGRVDAIARAVQVAENALERRLPAGHCAQTPIAPAVLVRDCRGIRVEMRAGVDAPFYDVIAVSRSRLPPMP
jgi:hypothetical protein